MPVLQRIAENCGISHRKAVIEGKKQGKISTAVLDRLDSPGRRHRWQALDRAGHVAEVQMRVDVRRDGRRALCRWATRRYEACRRQEPRASIAPPAVPRISDR